MVFLLTLFGYIKFLQKKETWSIKDWMVKDQRIIITWIYKFIFILLLSHVTFVINALKNSIHSVGFTIQTKVKYLKYLRNIQFSSVQSLSHVWLFTTPSTAARQASLSITNSWSLLKLMSIGRRQWQPTPVLLPEKSHWWRSLVGCSPWGPKPSSRTLGT